ncbi:hypothetical protein LTR24_006864 [Lithohypha guttulata]|uniref:Lysine-specific metallo-endopeptidase domain-containing protein n=1 Tax=Lithohypha guttulata TaxID=1690604 RepID=A0ABR0K4N3_9EURO|nr:hypothetical protein LTR24_006864 [Lithohypha guttulata]
MTPSNISRRAVDANTAELFNWFEFCGFDQHPNERNAVVNAMIGAWVGVQNALATLDKDPRNPSFLRYFQPNNVWTVQDNLRAVLAVMGMPQLEEERKCLGTIPKLQIWYGDTPAGVVDACKKPVDKQPWGFRDEYQDQSGERRDFVIFCDIYYRRYRDIRDVKCTELGTDSTPKGYGKGSTWSASMVTLHELLHWRALTNAATGIEIEDQVITRPDTKEETKCYEPFYSKALIDWDTKIPPTTNVDNYVSFVTESFFAFLCPMNRPWEDPADPGYVFPLSSEQ